MKHPFDQVNINGQLVTADLWHRNNYCMDKHRNAIVRMTSSDGAGPLTITVSVLDILNAIEDLTGHMQREQECLDAMCKLIDLDMNGGKTLTMQEAFAVMRLALARIAKESSDNTASLLAGSVLAEVSGVEAK